MFKIFIMILTLNQLNIPSKILITTETLSIDASEIDIKRSFVVGQEGDSRLILENNTFIHISFDKLLYENTIGDDRGLLNLEMVGKGSLTQKSAK